jgi:hypothetical protein
MADRPSRGIRPHLIALIGAGTGRSSDPLAAVEAAAALRDLADSAIVAHVAEARRRGASWAEIGGALGMARQSAHDRFADVIEEAHERPLPGERLRAWPEAGLAEDGVAVTADLDGLLEDEPAPRYGLSARAAHGVLRRAERRGEAIPAHLRADLEVLRDGADADLLRE